MERRHTNLIHTFDPDFQWAGKTGEFSFDVDIVSLHVHERIGPLTIIQAEKKIELQEAATVLP